MVDGKVLYTDSTHLKANANKHKFTREEVRLSTSHYWDELEEAIAADRQTHGKAPLGEAKDAPPPTKEIKRSTTDPESGYMVRDGKPKGFFYLDHRTVDGLHSIITDVHTTAANIHDSVPYLDRLDRQRTRFGFTVDAVGLDAGYFTPHICKGLEEREIFGVIGYRRPNHGKGFLSKRQYTYDAETDSYHCPAGERLVYRTTDRKGYRHYTSDPSVCQECSYLAQCTRNAQTVKTITRHVWQEYKDRVDTHRLTDRGKALYARRKETVERSFADAKELHGHRWAKRRGLSKVREQSLLCAAVQNMKKIALYLWKNQPDRYRTRRTTNIDGFSLLLSGFWRFWSSQNTICAC
jgi:hypothetical protein